MATLTMQYNPRNKTVSALIEILKTFSGVKVVEQEKKEEKCAYDPKYVAKIKAIDAQDKKNFKPIKSQDLWK